MDAHLAHPIRHPAPHAQIVVQKHRLPGKLLEPHRRSGAQRVILRHGDEQLLRGKPAANDAVALHGTVGDDEPALPADKRVLQLVDGHDFCVDGAVGIEVSQLRRQVPHGRGGAGADGDGVQAAGVGPKLQRKPLRLREKRLCLLDGLVSDGAEHHPILPPVKQRNVQLLLQPLHGAGERRLGYVQRPRSPGDRTELRYGNQLLQLRQLKHDAYLPLICYPDYNIKRLSKHPDKEVFL